MADEAPAEAPAEAPPEVAEAAAPPPAAAESAPPAEAPAAPAAGEAAPPAEGAPPADGAAPPPAAAEAPPGPPPAPVDEVGLYNKIIYLSLANSVVYYIQNCFIHTKQCNINFHTIQKSAKILPAYDKTLTCAHGLIA